MAETIDTTPLIDVLDVRKSTITKPPIVHEYVVPEYTKIVQPVIHKSVVKTEIRQITQPIYEEITRPVRIHEVELSQEVKSNLAKTEVLEGLISRNESAQPKIFTTYAPATTKKVILQPIVYENVITEIIEEIQPIIHRTIHETHIVKKQEVIHENIQPAVSVEATIREHYVATPVAQSEAYVIATATTATTTATSTATSTTTMTETTVAAELSEPVELPKRTETDVDRVVEAFLNKDVGLREMKHEIENLERHMKADTLGPSL